MTGPYLDPGTGGSAFVAAISQPYQPQPDYAASFARAVATPVGSGVAFDPGYVDDSRPWTPSSAGGTAAFDPGVFDQPAAEWSAPDYVPIGESGVAQDWLSGDRHMGSGVSHFLARDGDKFDEFLPFDPAQSMDRDVPADFTDYLNQRGAWAPPQANYEVFRPDAVLDPSQIQDRRPGQDKRPPWEVAFNDADARRANMGKWIRERMPRFATDTGAPFREFEPFDTHDRGGGRDVQVEPPDEYESLRNAFEPLVRAYQHGGEWDPDAIQVLTSAALAARQQAQDTPPTGQSAPTFTPEQVEAMGRDAPELQRPYFLDSGDERGPQLAKPLGYLPEVDEIAGQRMSGQNLANVLDALAAPERSFRAFILDHNLAASEQSEEYRRLRASGMDELGAATQVRADAERVYAEAEKGAMWSGAGAPFPTFGVPVLLNMLDPRNAPEVRAAATDQVGGAISSALLDPTNLIDLTPAGFLLLAGVRGARMSTNAAARHAVIEALEKTGRVNVDDPNIIKVVDRFVRKPEDKAAQQALADVFKAAGGTTPGRPRTEAQKQAAYEAATTKGMGDAIEKGLIGGATSPKPSAQEWAAAFGEQFVNPPEGKTARVVRTAQDEATGVAAAIVEPNPKRARIVKNALRDFPSHASEGQRASSQPHKGAEIAKVLREAFRNQLNLTPETFIAMPGIRQQLRDSLAKHGGNPRSTAQVRQLADALIQRERVAVLAGKADEVYKAAIRSGVPKSTARKMMDEAMTRYRDFVPDGKGGGVVTDIEKEVPPPTLALPGGQRLALPAPGQTAPRTTQQMAQHLIARAGGTIKGATEPTRITAGAARKEIQRLKALAQEPLLGKDTPFDKAKRLRKGLPTPAGETALGTQLKTEFRRLTNSGMTPDEALATMFPPGTPGYVIDGQMNALRRTGSKGTAVGEAGTPTGWKSPEADMRLGEYWRSLSPVQKFEFLWSSPKALLATGDLGWTMRQGGAILMAALTGGDVKGAARMIRRELDAFKSQEFADRAIEEITLADDYVFLRENGLAVQFTRDDQDWLANMAGKKSERNEVMQVSLAHFIDLRLNVRGRKIGLPLGDITRASERAGAVYLNTQRVDMARAFIDLRRAIEAGDKGAVGLGLPGGNRLDTGIGRGVELSDTNTKDYFRFLNALSGRGSFGTYLERVPGAPMVLSLPFFAPRWAISRFQLMLEPSIPLMRGVTSLARGQGGEAAGHFTTAAQEIQIVAKWWAATAGVIKMAQLAGWEPELDTTSTNFGTIPIGETGMRIDLIPGGMRTVFVFLAREISNTTTSSTGRTRVLGAPGPFQQDRLGLIGDFVMNKLNVPISVARNLITGENFGDPYGPFARDDDAIDRLEGSADVAKDTMVPLPLGATIEAILNGGPLGAIFGATEFFGMGSLGTSSQKKKAEQSDAQRALPPTTSGTAPATPTPSTVPTLPTPGIGGGGRILRR